MVDLARASQLLHPLRISILALAREPISATELGARMGLPRQKVNYHVRQLARFGFLRRAGRRRRRNMVEQRYVASAGGLILAPQLLGAVAADWRRIQDARSAEYLLALASQMQWDLVRASKENRDGQGVATVTIKSQFRFETQEQQDGFTRALRDAVIEVIARHSSPNFRADGNAGAGRAFRLVLGCYPYSSQAKARE